MNKVMVRLGTLGLIAVTSFAVGCSSSKKKEEAAQAQAAQAPAQQAMNQLEADRAQYVQTTQARIDQISQFADQLNASSAQIATTDRAKAKKQENAAEDLRSLLNDVRKELSDVRTAQTENWVDEKRDVQEALNRTETMYSNSVTLMQ